MMALTDIVFGVDELQIAVLELDQTPTLGTPIDILYEDSEIVSELRLKVTRNLQSGGVL